MTSKSASTANYSNYWEDIFNRFNIGEHNFDIGPFHITAREIKEATSNKEPRVLCYHAAREDRPRVFQEKGLFILPIRNGEYSIIKGEGYVDVPSITTPIEDYSTRFPFDLETSKVGNSEMQHLDFAYALSLMRNFVGDETLVLTIRGRKRTPAFDFVTGEFVIDVKGVQTEVDGGYEGEKQVVLVEAKGGNATNTIIRQLYYPFRQWQTYTNKKISTLFFQRAESNEYHFWQYGFDDPHDYNSIQLLRSGRYRIIGQP